MRTLSNLLAIVVTAALIMGLCPSPASAHEAMDLSVGGIAAQAKGDIASGVSGTCIWTIDSDGVLSIRPTSGAEGDLGSWAPTPPWHRYCRKITSARFEGKIKAQTCKMMFYYCTSLSSIDLSGLDTSNVTDMGEMFRFCWSLGPLDLSPLVTSKVTNMNDMFFGYHSSTPIGLSSFETSNVTDMSGMFNGCSGMKSLDLSHFDTANVTDMNGMFNGCSSLASLNLGPSFNTSKVTDMSWMFSGCSTLASLDVSALDTSKVMDMNSMFQSCRTLTSLDMSRFDTSKVENMSGMFNGCSSLASLNLGPSFNTSKVMDMNSMFQSCRTLTSLDMSRFDTSKVENMSGMLSGCSSLTSLNLSALDMSIVTNTSSMFEGCSSLVSLDLSKWDVRNVTNMMSMFKGCISLTLLNLSGLDTSSVTYMGYMFYSCSSLESLDLSSLDTSKVTDMGGMFADNEHLESLDVSGWDTSNVESVGAMFSGCSSLASLDLSDWDVSNVTTMEGMFSGCSSLASLDLSGWDTSRVTDMSWMFSGCSSLTSLDLSPFNTSRTISMISMFDGCSSLSSVVLGIAFSFNGAHATRQCSLPEGTWKAASDSSLYQASEIPNNVGDAYDQSSSIEGATVMLERSSYKFTGSEIEPVPTVILGDEELTAGKDFSTTYADNASVGTAAVVIDGVGHYHGRVSTTFEITPTISAFTASTVSETVELPYSATADQRSPTSNIVVSGVVGTVTYENISRNPMALGFLVEPDTGRITVKKGTPVGKYEFEVGITDSGDSDREATLIEKTYFVAIRSVPSEITASPISEMVVLPYNEAADQRIPGSNIVVSGAVGAVTYKNASDDPVAAGFLVDSSTGILTIPKKTPAGTYKVKATVCDAGDSNHQAAEKTVEYSVSVTSGPVAPVVVVEGVINDDLSWRLDDDRVLRIDGNGMLPDYRVGSAPWASSSSGIKRAIIGAGVTSIGDFCFYDCTSLESVDLPEGLESIGERAFAYCTSLGELRLPDTVSFIGDSAFIGLRDGSRVLCSKEVAALIQPTMYTHASTSIPFYSDGEKFDQFGGYGVERRTIELAARSKLVFETWAEGASTWALSKGGVEIAKGGSSGFAPGIVMEELVVPAGIVDLEMEFQSSEARYCRYTASAMIDEADVTLSGYEFAYTGQPIKPGVKAVCVGGVQLSEKDYAAYYSNNVDAGTATVTVVGKGKYTGRKSATFEISPAPITSVAPERSSRTYDGTAHRPDVSVKSGTAIVPPSGYGVLYSDNVDAGTATVTVVGKGNYTGRESATFEIARAANAVKVAKTSVKKKIAAKKLKKKAAFVKLPRAATKFGAAKWRVKAKDKKNALALSGDKVKVRKKTHKGSYKIKLKARVPATKNCKPATSKTVVVKVVVA